MISSIVQEYAIPTTRVTGILFSAEYCKWCKELTPLLKNAYKQMLDAEIDIVMVSSDKTKEAHDEYTSQFDWNSLSFEDIRRSELRILLNIKTIPAMVFVDRDGNIIEQEGRDRIRSFCQLYEESNWVPALSRHLNSTEYDSDDEDF